MPSPFPGMDPYLESPRFCPDLHAGLIFAMKEDLQGRLSQAYYAQCGQRVWLDISQRYIEPDVNVMRERREIPHRGHGGVTLAEPEVEVETERTAGEPVLITVEDVRNDDHLENYIEIHGRWSGQDRLIATIEVVSPSNKAPGDDGYDTYRTKQREILAGQAHLIEIDLLRAGAHITAVPKDIAKEKAGPFDYHVSVHRFERPKEYLVYPIRLQHRLPVITVPLLPSDPPVQLALQAAFNRAYDAGPYRKAIRYGKDPIDPPLQPEQATWAATTMKAVSTS
jgi:Protein of unknown function (DUF4058)